MAMLISKFHKLIQSKLLWATFLIIVVFTFVIWGTQVPSTAKAARDASAPGTLHGEPVDANVFRSAYFSTYLTVVMAVGRALDITPAIDEQLRKATWQRLAALQTAAQLGFTASDDEVAAAIQQHEGFTQDGQFNKAIYKAFVQQFLARMGFTERQFEEHVRDEIVMQKLRVTLDRGTLITPLELRRAFSSVSDRFQVSYVAIGADQVTDDVQVSREDARAFFDKDPALFTIPEKVKVQYVRIPAAPFIPKVKVTEEEAETYYNEHIEDYAIEEDTNDVAAADATNDLLNVGTTYRPFADVKQEISNQLIQRAALEQAAEQAMNFVVRLTPDRDGVAPTFAEAAREFELEVQDAGPFAAREEIEDVDAGLAFNRAAFELTEGAEGYFSNPVQGEEAVYVIALVERQPERVPAFEEVEDEVTPAARNQAIADALTRRAQHIRDSVDSALREGRTFEQAVEAFNLQAVNPKEFTATTGLLDDEEHGDRLLRAVLARNAGELTDLIPTEDSILLAYVAKRVPADPATFDSLRDQLVGMMRRQNGRVNFDAFQDYLLQEAKFEDRAATAPAGMDEDQPEEDAEPGQDAS